MSVSGIQGLPLEVTVVGCVSLRDTEWISRQDPCVSVEYGSSSHRTRTCTDGGKNPTFQEKFVIALVEGLQELKVSVWNSNALSANDFIGNGRIPLQKVLSQGYDDGSWIVQDKCGRYAGKVRLTLQYSYASTNAKINNVAGSVQFLTIFRIFIQQSGKTNVQVSVQPYATSTAPHYLAYYPAAMADPGISAAAPAYPPGPAYPPSMYPTYPQCVPTYPPPPAAAIYAPPPAGYPTCPPPAYPLQYPPAPHTSVYPSGPPVGVHASPYY